MQSLQMELLQILKEDCRVPLEQLATMTGAQLGMQTLDQNLLELVRRNVVSAAEARGKAANKDNFPGA